MGSCNRRPPEEVEARSRLRAIEIELACAGIDRRSWEAYWSEVNAHEIADVTAEGGSNTGWLGRFALVHWVATCPAVATAGALRDRRWQPCKKEMKPATLVARVPELASSGVRPELRVVVEPVVGGWRGIFKVFPVKADPDRPTSYVNPVAKMLQIRLWRPGKPNPENVILRLRKFSAQLEIVNYRPAEELEWQIELRLVDEQHAT